MRNLARSTAVRLAFGYALLFVVSSLLLMGFLWWRTTIYLDREIDAVILADGQAIADRFRDFGLPGAIETINERVGHAGDEHAIYLLVDPTLRPVAGNLQAWPLAVGSAPGWYQINLVRDNKIYAAQSLFARLPDGFRLLVARDVQDRLEVRSLIVDCPHLGVPGWSRPRHRRRAVRAAGGVAAARNHQPDRERDRPGRFYTARADARLLRRVRPTEPDHQHDAGPDRTFGRRRSERLECRGP